MTGYLHRAAVVIPDEPCGYVPTDDYEHGDADAPDAPPVQSDDSQPSTAQRIQGVGTDVIFAPLPPVNWVVEGFDICPGPPVIVGGYGFSAKTVAWQSAAIEIATGRRVWGAYAAGHGRVVHLDYEQGSRLTCERYQRLAYGLDIAPQDVGGNLAVSCLPEVYLDSHGAENDLCRAFDGAVLGIIGSFRAACPSIEENSSAARRPLDMLTRVSERTGATVVVLLHARKPQKDAPGGARMAIRGSSAIYDASSSVLIHEAANKGEPVRILHEKARTSGRLADDALLRVEDVPSETDPRAGLVVRAERAPSADDAAAAKSRAKVVALTKQLQELFRAEPEQASANNIATKLGRRRADVRQAIDLMLEAGDLQAIGSTSNRRLKWVGPK